jgi:hypothetical protein
MSPDTSPEIERFRDEMVLSKIKKGGWGVIACPEEKDSPPFAFTIGLFEKFGHPEIILFGMDSRESAKALNFMGARIQDGEVFKALQAYNDVLTSQCMFAPVDVQQDYWLGYARWYYKKDFPAIQCVWADTNGRWPWNTDCDPGVAGRQMILNETARRHNWLETKYYPTGAAATTIVRRYLTWPKFNRLLDDAAIYFRNVTLFADKFEGSIPKNLYSFYKDTFTQFATQAKQNVAVAAYLEEQRTRRHKANLHASYVNCWFARPHESAGMWTGYAQDKIKEGDKEITRPGVAIESTYEALLRSFTDELPSEHDFVQYANFDTDAFKTGKLRYDFSQQPLNFKRIEYKDEHELRLIVFRTEEAEAQLAANVFKPASGGINLKVSLETLLQKTIAGPGATDVFLSNIQAALKAKGLNVPVVKSALDGNPLY